MEHKIIYTKNRHGYARIKNNILLISIPHRLKNDKKFINELLGKGKKLINRKGETYKKIDGNSVWIFGEEVNISKLELGKEGLESFLKNTLIEYCLPIVEKYSEIVGYKFKKLHIKKLKSKWGSCSAIQNISLNLDLIHMPTRFARYVTIHEVCHLKHKNHSKKFRDEVANFIDYKTIKKEMRNMKMVD